jgi:hypothetical protein
MNIGCKLSCTDAPTVASNIYRGTVGMDAVKDYQKSVKYWAHVFGILLMLLLGIVGKSSPSEKPKPTFPTVNRRGQPQSLFARMARLLNGELARVPQKASARPPARRLPLEP